MSEFRPVTPENIKDVEKYLSNGKAPQFCDFTPFVILMWQKMYKTEYTVCDSVLYLKFLIENTPHFAVASDDVFSHLDTLFSFEKNSVLRLSLVSDNGVDIIKRHCENVKVTNDVSWSDYVYSGQNLRELKGKKFAGQRNHINKFESLYQEWHYEKVTADNARHVADFFEEITDDTLDTNDSRSFETNMVKEYLENFTSFETLGGFVTANGKIVSFAFGEIIDDMLYVHVEKADRNIAGAYPIIVREFARANPTPFINREEDMGIEGLKKSKLSWHPIKLLQKNNVEIF